MNVSKYIINDNLLILDRLFLNGDEIFIEGSDPVNDRPQKVFTTDRTMIGSISRDVYWKLKKKLSKAKSIEPTDKSREEFKENCEKCAGRIGLISGYFGYEADSEPYESGIEEEAKFKDGDKFLLAYKCDECGHIQNFSYE